MPPSVQSTLIDALIFTLLWAKRDRKRSTGPAKSCIVFDKAGNRSYLQRPSCELATKPSLVKFFLWLLLKSGSSFYFFWGWLWLVALEQLIRTLATLAYSRFCSGHSESETHPSVEMQYKTVVFKSQCKCCLHFLGIGVNSHPPTITRENHSCLWPIRHLLAGIL